MAILRTVMLAAVAALLAGCAGPDVRGPFRNQYVDADTGKPIEGVVFLAVWHSVTPNFVSGGSEPFYDAREVVSGPDGHVEIAGLTGPVWRFGLGVRFYEFAPRYGRQGLQVMPPDGQTYVDLTLTRMKYLSTPQERCEVMDGSLIPSAPGDQMPRYAKAVSDERTRLRCGRSPQE